MNMSEDFINISRSLDTLTLAQVAEKINVKDVETAKKWLQEKRIKIHRFLNNSFVYQIEVDSQIDKPFVQQLRNKYPDKWKDMSNLKIDRNSYAANVMACSIWQHQYNTNKYGKPVDRTEWNMEPQTYNAYYEPTNNEIVIPACNIIVPGYEGRMPDDAVLYGVIGGSTIGHEITHGFDDQGSQYDPEGNLRNWWSKEDKAKFDKRTKQIVAQFNQYKVLDSLKINGEATQGENIADLGGVVMGYEAFKKTKQGQSTEKIGGLTPDQRYFLSYAYSWMVQMRPESMARRIKTDVHSPAEYRVIGPVSNNENFYKAFNIQPGQFMYRNDSSRVKIW